MYDHKGTQDEQVGKQRNEGLIYIQLVTAAWAVFVSRVEAISATIECPSAPHAETQGTLQSTTENTTISAPQTDFALIVVAEVGCCKLRG